VTIKIGKNTNNTRSRRHACDRNIITARKAKEILVITTTIAKEMLVIGNKMLYDRK
jgi:hypothetical protein